MSLFVHSHKRQIRQSVRENIQSDQLRGPHVSSACVQFSGGRGLLQLNVFATSLCCLFISDFSPTAELEVNLHKLLFFFVFFWTLSHGAVDQGSMTSPPFTSVQVARLTRVFVANCDVNRCDFFLNSTAMAAVPTRIICHRAPRKGYSRIAYTQQGPAVIFGPRKLDALSVCSPANYPSIPWWSVLRPRVFFAWNDPSFPLPFSLKSRGCGRRTVGRTTGVIRLLVSRRRRWLVAESFPALKWLASGSGKADRSLKSVTDCCCCHVTSARHDVSGEDTAQMLPDIYVSEAPSAANNSLPLYRQTVLFFHETVE
jgi:hypothetical protein